MGTESPLVAPVNYAKVTTGCASQHEQAELGGTHPGVLTEGSRGRRRPGCGRTAHPAALHLRHPHDEGTSARRDGRHRNCGHKSYISPLGLSHWQGAGSGLYTLCHDCGRMSEVMHNDM